MSFHLTNILNVLFKENDDLNIFLTHKETRVIVTKDEIAIVVEGVLMTTDQLAEAVVIFLAHCYLLDVCYPPQWEISLTLLQFLSFGDLQAPFHIMSTVHDNWKQLVFNGNSKLENFKYQRFL